MILFPIAQAVVFVAVVFDLVLRGGIPRLGSPHKDDYKRVTKDLAMRERRRAAKLTFGRAPIPDPRDGLRAQILARALLADTH